MQPSVYSSHQSLASSHLSLAISLLKHVAGSTEYITVGAIDYCTHSQLPALPLLVPIAPIVHYLPLPALPLLVPIAPIVHYLPLHPAPPRLQLKCHNPY